MSDAVHLSLFHTGRAQCPECAAPLPLVENRPIVECGYCGATSVVERRMRMIEPLPAPELVTVDTPDQSTRQLRPSQVIPVLAQDESHCPACGAMMESGEIQAIRRCRQCGTQCKIEARLLRRTGADEDLQSLEHDPKRNDPRNLAETESLLNRVINGTELVDRVRAAHELTDSWLYLNTATVRKLPQVMEVMRQGDPRLEIPLSELIGKLLCEGDARLARATVRAAEKFTFDENGSRSLLWQLGLGSAIGLKLLLDSADYAATRGGVDYACAALWAINSMMERNFPRRVAMAEIILYRLLYLRGPVQAWALEVCKGQMGLGIRFSTPTLLHFLDDCACERPELVPHIQRCFYGPAAATPQEFNDRLAIMDTLLTPPARCSALEQLYAPPRTMPEPDVAQVLERLLGYAANPVLAKSAIEAMNNVFEDYPGPRPGVDIFIGAHGDALPEAVRRIYFRHAPSTKLLSALPPRYDSYAQPAPSEFDRQLEQWTAMWGDGIRRAVDYQRDRQRTAREYWDRIGRT